MLSSNEVTDVTRTLPDSGKSSLLSEEEIRELLDADAGTLKNFGRLQPIGVGGEGAVYSAVEPGLRREVAIKMLLADYRFDRKRVTGFLREARTTAQIDHPNIVPVHRIGYSKDTGIYFTMKRIEGRDLRSVILAIRSKKPSALRFASLVQRLEIFIAVCHGVAFAHSKGIVHCDLKPSNIMVGDYGEVMIMDWGLSMYRREKDLAQGGQHIDLARTGEDAEENAENAKTLSNRKPGSVRVCGTPTFMSPEQAAGRMDLVDEHSDIYSLGAILYCLLTLETAPVEPGRPTQEVLNDVAAGRIVRPRRRSPKLGIPRELEAVTLKAMAHDIAGRYGSVQELLADVRRFMDKFPVPAYGGSRFYRCWKWCVRKPLIPLLVLTGLLAGGGVRGTIMISDRLAETNQLRFIRNQAGQAEAYYDLAIRSVRNRSSGSGSVSEAEYLRRLAEFYNYGNSALEGIAALESKQWSSAKVKKEMMTLLCRLLRQKIHFSMETGNETVLYSTLHKFQNRWRNSRADIMETDPELDGIIRDVLQGIAGLLPEVPPDAVLRIRKEDPEHSSAGEWTELPANVRRRMPAGSYLVEALHAGRKATFPVVLLPGGRHVLRIRKIPDIPEGFVLVPNGWFFGGRIYGQKTFLPDFFIQEREVTLREYLAFWKQLSDPAEKQRFRAVVHQAGHPGRYLWDDAGNLQGIFSPDLPVVGISGEAAEAYCRYRTQVTGRLHRLPTANEWEKALRGEDKRMYAWGEVAVKTNACTADYPELARYRGFAAAPGSFPMDRSVYGALDMTGNVREMVRNREDRGKVYRVMGGSFMMPLLQASGWTEGSTGTGEPDVGFRCVIEPPEGSAENVSGEES